MKSMAGRVTHIEFLVEEQSMEKALEHLLPKILPDGITFKIHPHQGKRDLLKKLPGKLRGYVRWIRDETRICVLVDRDSDDCHELKARLNKFALEARIEVLNRIAIEELEAWFFGDVPALVKAYRGVSPTLDGKAKFRDPDAIRGGTWEALERVLQRAGYFKAGLAKIKAADDIARHMDPSRNRLHSFKVFISGLESLLGTLN